MKNARIQKLAKLLIDYSVDLSSGENILIENFGTETDLARELINYAVEKGAYPLVSVKNNLIAKTLVNSCSQKQLELMASFDAARMDHMHAYISIRSTDNINEMSLIPSDKQKLYTEYYVKPVHFDIRIKKKWCILRYPNPSMAQLASMPTEEFEDFYFDVCTLDYSKMSNAMDNLVDIMSKTDKVKITGQGTDLTFSIKGLPPIKCAGKFNIPDGEVFSAPIKTSVNGHITYNTPSLYNGTTFENVRFEFKNGKIVDATSNHTEKLNKILDTDEGARYVGEFSFGLNPLITKPMNDILFDEKISGSIHFTPGNSYDECDNGNKSSVHWDLVYVQRPEFGGGDIWFDDILIRRDGLFVLDSLKCLNPENLI